MSASAPPSDIPPVSAYVARFDAWPVLHVRAPSHDTDVSTLARIVDIALSRGGRWATVFDVRGAEILPARVRRELSDLIVDKTPELRATLAGAAIVFGNALERGVSTAVFWVSPPPMPTATFTSVAEATVWAEKQLRVPGQSQ